MLTINFTGDISFTGIFNKKVKNNVEIFSNEIRDYFLKSDFNICNFEGAATNKKNILGYKNDIKSPTNSIQYLKKRGFCIFNLANNHVFDSGIEGFRDTREKIIEQDCRFFGAGENIEEASKIVYLEKNGIKVALMGVCHKEGMIAGDKNAGIFCDCKTDLITEKVKEAKRNADWVVLNYHGGEEYTTIPMPRRRRLLRNFINYGVDIIVAHHPHVFQGYEKINNRIIFYSLGNFVFDIDSFRSKELTDEGAVLNIQFTQNSFRFNFLPIKIDRVSGFISSAPKKEFESRLLKLSNFENYTSKWRRDAYRAFFQPNVIERRNLKSLRGKNKLSLIFTPRTYFSICRILKSPNSRSVFLSALIYKLLNKLAFKNYV